MWQSWTSNSGPGRSLRSTVPRATQAETPGAGEKRCRQVTHWLGTLLWKIWSSSGLMGVSVTGPGLSFLSGSPHLFSEVLCYPNTQARQMSELSVAVGGQSADLGMFRPRPGLFLRVHRGPLGLRQLAAESLGTRGSSQVLSLPGEEVAVSKGGGRPLTGEMIFSVGVSAFWGVTSGTPTFSGVVSPNQTLEQILGEGGESQWYSSYRYDLQAPWRSLPFG